MVNVVCVMNERITVRKWRESWKILERVLAEKFCPCCSILIQNFDASLAVKMMVICCILCGKCALQKLFHLVA